MLIEKIILASESKIRADLLTNAGINFLAVKANINEKEIQKNLGTSIKDMALFLAKEKALSISKINEFNNKIVIGCDQTLIFENKLLHKVTSKKEAFLRLKKFSNKSHILETAVVVAKNNKIIWSYVDQSIIFFRKLSDDEINKYLDKQKEKIFKSVTAYQIETSAIQFLKEIKGDYFSILGLPLIPLINFLNDIR
ncbi:nucleoside triphosphate pyrophosphatase [Bartonella sp. DGB1]|uniref:Maf family protein n=1 Tax=Bartonella sp. DGB1 TaxID=3239807 RepID=UPI003525F043